MVFTEVWEDFQRLDDEMMPAKQGSSRMELFARWQCPHCPFIVSVLAQRAKRGKADACAYHFWKAGTPCPSRPDNDLRGKPKPKTVVPQADPSQLDAANAARVGSIDGVGDRSDEIAQLKQQMEEERRQHGEQLAREKKHYDQQLELEKKRYTQQLATTTSEIFRQTIEAHNHSADAHSHSAEVHSHSADAHRRTASKLEAMRKTFCVSDHSSDDDEEKFPHRLKRKLDGLVQDASDSAKMDVYTDVAAVGKFSPPRDGEDVIAVGRRVHESVAVVVDTASRMQSVQQRADNLEAMVMCRACMTRPSSVMFMKCKHAPYCATCYNQVVERATDDGANPDRLRVECPECRAKTSTVVRLRLGSVA